MCFPFVLPPSLDASCSAFVLVCSQVDHPEVNIRGFPTIKFFPAGDKSNVIEYDGARDLAGLTEFLKKEAKVKFTLADDEENDEL